MTVYIVTLISIVLYGCICFFKGTTKRNKIIFLCLAFAHMWFVMAMRDYKVGNDTESYCRLFLRWGYSKVKIGGATQPIYYLYNRLIYFLNQNGQAIIMCNSLLELIGVALFIYYFSANVFLSTYLWISLYFFCESMNISRQFLALSLMLISFVFLWKKNNVKLGLTFFVLAIGVHNLAITLAPVFLAKLIHLSRKKIFALAAAGTIFAFLFDKIFTILINGFCFIFPYYNQYLETGQFNVYNEGGSRNVLLSLFYLVFVVLAFILLENEKISPNQKESIIILLVPCVITVAIGLGAINITSVQRIKILYGTFFICLIPNVISCFSKKIRVIANLFVMIITCLPFGIQLLENYGGVVPYSFFWK